MKRSIFIFLSLLSSIIVHSQPFDGGFFAGLSGSQVDGDTYSGFNKLGLTAGAYISAELQRDWKWKAELRYVQKGAFKKTSTDNPDYYRLTIHYVELPLLAQYYVNKDFFIEGGLAPDVYLYHREEDEYGQIEDEDGPAYHRFGLNLTAGFGYFLSDHVAAGLRYSYSAISMRDHASGQTYLLNRGQYNNVLTVNLYYHFQ